MDLRISIRARQTVRHGTAFDLYYRWKGVRYRPVLGCNLTEEQAHQRAVEMIQIIQRGQTHKSTRGPRDLTLEHVLPLYYDNLRIKGRVDVVRPKGIIENYLLPFFGSRSLRSLSAEDGLPYILGRQEAGASPGTIRREWQVLMRILNLAVAYDKLDRNRLKAVDLPERTKRERIAEPDELEAIRRVANPDLWRVLLVALQTGLRESKILSIERHWIRRHADGFWLHLPPARTKIKGNPSAIPLNKIALAALDVDIYSITDGRIFRRWSDLRSFKKRWAITCKRAKVINLHFHDLRHTFATRLQRLGVDYELRQALLGHTMPGMTAAYSHGGPEWDRKLRAAVALLEKPIPQLEKRGTELSYVEVLSYGLSYGMQSEEMANGKLLKNGEPPGTRTQGPRLKRAMLYRLS